MDDAVTLDFWFARAAILAASLVMVPIRAPHGQRSRQQRVVANRRGRLESALLALAWASFFVPIVWALTPFLSFADLPLHPIPFAAGLASLAGGLWLLHRSHADLGLNWSITLEVRERHELVTRGVYRRVRHPMYSALLLYSAGQALAVPNWIAGPSYLLAFALLVALRLAPEERMMADVFGEPYRAYVRRTRRLIPGVW